MVAATEKEMQEYLSGHGNLRCNGKSIGFDYPEAKSIRLDLRVSEPHQFLYLARLVAHLRYEEIQFEGASLWITQSGVWNSLQEAVALTTIERFRQGYGENRSLQAAPGHFFRHDEFVESVACLLQPILIGWDAYYVPRWAWGALDYFVVVSHDSFIDIQTRTIEMYEEAVRILKVHEWLKVAVANEG
ncbi:MAG TPA: hypothetical protein VMT67_13105 [Terriglobales bacterium]|nr:hypothetical protein [Terriglobales bacterium]